MRTPLAMLILLLVASLDAACDADFMPEKTGCSPAGSPCDGDRDCVPFSCTCATARLSGTIAGCASGKCSTDPCTSLCGSANGVVLSSVEQPLPAYCAGSSGNCGNGKCDSSKGETCSSCEKDCGRCMGDSGVGTCGNGACDAVYGESCSSCPVDCCAGGGVCVAGCTSSSSCTTSGLPICKSTTCVQCTTSSQCNGRSCSTSAGRCTCSSDKECSALGMPYCISSKGRCGVCRTDADCVGQPLRRCNPDTNLCSTCTSDSECCGGSPPCTLTCQSGRCRCSTSSDCAPLGSNYTCT